MPWGYIILFIQYYSTIYRPSDHTVGRLRFEIRTRRSIGTLTIRPLQYIPITQLLLFKTSYKASQRYRGLLHVQYSMYYCSTFSPQLQQNHFWLVSGYQVLAIKCVAGVAARRRDSDQNSSGWVGSPPHNPIRHTKRVSSAGLKKMPGIDSTGWHPALSHHYIRVS